MTRRYRTLIVDDEPVARRGVRLLLERDPSIDIVGECETGEEAVEQLRSSTPDLLFLDVQMPEMHGLEVLARAAVDPAPAVVFVTAFDEHAVAAFESHAIDYVLKPYSDERFAAALERAKLALEQRDAWSLRGKLRALLDELAPGSSAPAEPAPSARGDWLRWVTVRTAGRVRVLKTSAIDWIEAADNYVRLHVGRTSHLLHEAMADLEGRLDPREFVRIHRGTIVRLDRIHELQPYFRGEYVVILLDGTRLKLARHRQRRLEEALGHKL